MDIAHFQITYPFDEILILFEGKKPGMKKSVFTENTSDGSDGTRPK